MKEADRKKQAIRYLRGKMESRELEEDEIARLNAIGFVDDEYNPFVRHAPVKTMGSSTTRKTVIRRSTVTWIR